MQVFRRTSTEVISINRVHRDKSARETKREKRESAPILLVFSHRHRRLLFLLPLEHSKIKGMHRQKEREREKSIPSSSSLRFFILLMTVVKKTESN